MKLMLMCAIQTNHHNNKANPGYFEQPAKTPIWLDEQRLVTALDGLNYSVYYESARAEQLQTNGLYGTVPHRLFLYK